MSEDTPAIREVTASGVPFRVVRTERARSAEESAALQGIEIGRLIRTIVVRRGAGDYVFVLVPGGRQIDWPLLRAHLGVSRLSLPDQEEAKEATGYERGAITPFASTTTWPVVADATLTGPDPVAIGAGAHGVNLHLDAADLVRLLDADVADVTVPRTRA
ncbi:MAG: aminoacyl-tRNA deacylase [Actinomycetota bacterium]